MHLVETVLQKHRDKAVLGLLVFVSLTLLVFPESLQLTIARGALNTLLFPAQKAGDFMENLRGTQAENRRLRRMVASLLIERERLTQFRQERERLRRLAAFKEDQFYDLEPCEVVGRNLDRFQTVLVIDKGAKDGIAAKMPVLSYQGLVGRVVEVFDESSWVQLICSKNHPVSCIDKRSRVVGILEWRERDRFDLTSVGVVEDVQVGDTLVTSGFGGVVPKGFVVAIVTRVGKASDGISLAVEARSQVKFRSLEEVFVMKDEIPWDRAILYNEADSALADEVLNQR